MTPSTLVMGQKFRRMGNRRASIFFIKGSSSIHSFVDGWVATSSPCTPPCSSPHEWRWWRSAGARSLTDQSSVAQTPPTCQAPLGLCRCRPGGRRHLVEESAKNVPLMTKWTWGGLVKHSTCGYSHGVSSSGRKVTVAVSCLMMERISSWMDLMDFSLGTLRNTRKEPRCTTCTMEWVTKMWQWPYKIQLPDATQSVETAAGMETKHIQKHKSKWGTKRWSLCKWR